jgi:hypothetical protein
MVIESLVMSSFYPFQILSDIKMDRKEIGLKDSIWFIWLEMRLNGWIVMHTVINF